MRILLFGSDGQIGWELQRSLSVLGELVLSNRGGGDGSVDFADPASLRRVSERVRPDVIVNAAAYTAVDRAEGDERLAQAVNAEGPEVLAQLAIAQNAWLVHYSTDYVFDGAGDRPWNEDDPTRPVNTYGRTKLDGEQRIRATGCRHLILRTSWIYSSRSSNFLRTIVRLAVEREDIRVVSDQIGAPTSAELMADVTAHTLRAAILQPDLGGTYHACAAGTTSWHDYASTIVDWMRTNGWPVKVRPDGLLAVPSTAYPTVACRPLNSRLDTTRLQRAFGLSMPDWRAGVIRTLAAIPKPCVTP